MQANLGCCVQVASERRRRCPGRTARRRCRSRRRARRRAHRAAGSAGAARRAAAPSSAGRSSPERRAPRRSAQSAPLPVRASVPVGGVEPLAEIAPQQIPRRRRPGRSCAHSPGDRRRDGGSADARPSTRRADWADRPCSNSSTVVAFAPSPRRCCRPMMPPPTMISSPWRLHLAVQDGLRNACQVAGVVCVAGGC